MTTRVSTRKSSASEGATLVSNIVEPGIAEPGMAERVASYCFMYMS